MLMAAATHMVGSAHSSSTSSSLSPPPSHPVVLVPNHHHQQVLHDLDLATPFPSPSPSLTTPAATTSPPRQNHLLRPASRRSGKQRRPRPSRKLPTTYISADAASFRSMVHRVTGADDVLLPGPGPAAPEPELLCRPAPPSRGALTTTTMLTLLPTLDTSAFLLGAARRGGDDSGRAPSPARPPAASSCHGSSVVVVVDPGAALKAEARAGGGGFPSLESWDEDDALF